jgi:hypothetical protein
VIVRQREGGRKKKRKKRIPNTIHVFLLFLHAGKILIFIKNNMENIKYIPTVRFNSV